MSQICSKMANFLFTAYFDDHFCYHSNGKAKPIPEFYTSDIVQTNYLKEITEKQFLFFDLKGGQK